ncbi:hypothetical protein [Rhodococcus sp. 14-2470-1a]|uniref:hypothetical protein n=1 Tax=Rhodococcus sp. 14-2470-1a TaxID=2023150 RepID=UPI000B9A6D9D|nr:hypothetical protein [Rhodococcus sp. 14-2470-1a]OZF41898.1 hypothetical protein CH292_27210 [Rhodococcus sp. 14-2470-1a]
MTTHALLDAAAFLGAIVLFLLAALAVIVVVGGIIVAVVVAPIARIVRGRGPRDRVVIDHDQDGGLRFDGPVDPETEARMRAAFVDEMQLINQPPGATTQEEVVDAFRNRRTGGRA